MTFQILSDRSNKIVYCSNARSANDLIEMSIWLKLLVALVIAKSEHKVFGNKTVTTALSVIISNESLVEMPSTHIINPSDLEERTFLISTNNKSRQHLWVKIVKAIDDHEDDCTKDLSCFKFAYSMADSVVEEILS